MTGHFRTIAPLDSSLISAADREFVCALGPAIRRQFWLRFFTPGFEQDGVAIQLDGLPARADSDAPEHLARILSGVAEHGNWTALSIAIERRGGPDPTERDREWMHAVRAAATAAKLQFGTVMISHSRGVRMYVEREEPAGEGGGATDQALSGG